MINAIIICNDIQIISTLSEIFDDKSTIITSFIQVNDINEDLLENHKINIVLFCNLILTQQNKQLLENIATKNIPLFFIIKTNQISSLPDKTICNDFMLYPINNKNELIARIKRLVSKNTNKTSNPNYCKVGNLTINFDRYEISINRKILSLTYKEYQLIVLLSSSPSKVYSRDILLDNIWSYDYVGGTRTVDVHIRRIRSKLENASSTAKIKTIWNVGYKIEV